ncbi:hypothetical protein A8C32_08080 [Flavivirga aquatica]|uniref:Uncharacterized protein n=1 Tax=Flavivirga aquatica TaxID=1849968 RepID=A0A1E5SJ34_9FLAO|nr:hypothetical protein [Flavivirga aquatica]OEJ99123.1 hypothetical protein A8C32_08080 [Flavivirga aquatica]
MRNNIRYLQVYILLFTTLLTNTISWSQQDSLSNIESGYTYHSSIDITEVSGNTLSVNYKTLPANQAGKLQNKLWIWRASEVPWQYPPMKEQLLQEDATQSGSYVLENLKIAISTEYIVCYSVGPEVTQICTCATLSVNKDTINKQWVEISLLNISRNSISFSYKTLKGYLPKTYQNWFGLWEGQASPYNLDIPIAKDNVSSDSNISSGGLNNLSLDIGQIYTLIYFTGSQEANAAAMIRFKVY